MMNIRQLLDYYNGELTFNQIMHLFIEGEISLEGGIISSEDARTICDSYSEKSVDLRNLGVQQNLGSIVERASENSEGESLDDLLETVGKLESKLYHLGKELRGTERKARKKNEGKRNLLLKNEYETLIRSAEVYEKLFSLESDTDYLEKAASNRGNADNTLEKLPSRFYSNEKALNLFRLAELKVLLDKPNEAIEHLQCVEGIYHSVLEDIRGVDSKMRAEENALIGRVNLRLYGITKKQKYLDIAVNVLTAYEKIDVTGKYDDDYIQAIDLQEKVGTNK